MSINRGLVVTGEDPRVERKNTPGKKLQSSQLHASNNDTGNVTLNIYVVGYEEIVVEIH